MYVRIRVYMCACMQVHHCGPVTRHITIVKGITGAEGQRGSCAVLTRLRTLARSFAAESSRPTPPETLRCRTESWPRPVEATRRAGRAGGPTGSGTSTSRPTHPQTPPASTTKIGARGWGGEPMASGAGCRSTPAIVHVGTRMDKSKAKIF